MTPASADAIVIAQLDDNLIALGRVLGALRRRNLTVRTTASGPTAVPGVIRFTARLATDAATAEAVAQQLRKTVGVRDVVVQLPLPAAPPFRAASLPQPVEALS